jgi:hypothetical protein
MRTITSRKARYHKPVEPIDWAAVLMQNRALLAKYQDSIVSPLAGYIYPHESGLQMVITKRNISK